MQVSSAPETALRALWGTDEFLDTTRFAEVFARGTNEEKRAFARLFVQKIEVDPDTGDIWMHLFSRPPALLRKETPVSAETGAAIGLVAGACYVAMHNALAAMVVRRWRLPRNGRRG